MNKVEIFKNKLRETSTEHLKMALVKMWDNLDISIDACNFMLNELESRISEKEYILFLDRLED